MFFDDLKSKGWTEVSPQWEFVKGDWEISFDTGHWMIVATANNPRVFDVHAPRDYESVWTVNLIEHLCRMDDERRRLRHALEGIRDHHLSGQVARDWATAALQPCYHTWLINLDIPEGERGRIACPICAASEVWPPQAGSSITAGRE